MAFGALGRPLSMITLFGKPEPTLLERLKESVARTRSELAAHVEEILSGERRIDPALLEELETALLAADLGLPTTRQVLDAVRDKVARRALSDGAQLKTELKSQLLAILGDVSGNHGEPQQAAPDSEGDGQALRESTPRQPRVIFIVGVNGTGKTTTIGKLAYRLRQEGRSVLLCAADTFRAAATEQLDVWAGRVGVDVIKQKPGADPAAVVYDALAAARARSADAVIVDTAGRLHTKSNLMAELDKMKRTAGKLVPGAPHDVLLVMDATTGQNGLAQAREFTAAIGVTGIVLTKLDGTAKGGIIVAIRRELGLPIRFVGTGEKMNDLVPFDPKTFVNALFE
ncbi:MAG TPA: signal recognition particle-docking protein FtsY [Candidatus Acidoferrales bacterium]|nr:signal recognition particle-docking protein FtsY [Candidatus Acidoferrales bacterium]